MLTSYFKQTLCRNVPRAMAGSARYLNVQEYVSMDLMRKYNLPTPTCYTASTAIEAERLYNKLNPPNTNSTEKSGAAIIKAQVLTGGRGKGHFDNGFEGGVRFLTSASQARTVASQMLGAKLITKQAPNGLPCQKVLLRECFDLERELYLSIILDRQTGGPLLIASPSGGTSIEDLAASNPELIYTESIDIAEGITEAQCQRVATNLGFERDSPLYHQCMALTLNLYQMFLATNNLQIEINPLAETPQGQLVVADAKLVIDDRAAFRHPQVFAQRDFSQEDPREVTASKFDLNYVGLEGNVGCMVNGAGLSMATMDLLSKEGAEPACFLDVGGAAQQQSIDGAIELLHSDKNVEIIFVNIFGGIVRCDLIAQGLIEAFQKGKSNKPTVVRLAGNNSQKAIEMIKSSGITTMIVEHDWEVAVEKVVTIANACKNGTYEYNEMLTDSDQDQTSERAASV